MADDQSKPKANQYVEPAFKQQNPAPVSAELQAKAGIDKPASEKYSPVSVSPRPKRILVDEMREKAISVGYSTVIFRPGQHLESEHLQRLAKENDIATREV